MEAISISELDSIHRQVNRFPEGTTDSIDIVSTPRKQNPPAVLERRSPSAKPTDEIIQLESDIEQLQAVIQKQKADNRLLQAWQEYNRKSNVDPSDSPDVQHAYVESLRYELEYLHNITGIKIDSSSCKKSRKGQLGHVRTDLIDGSCGELQFQLKIQITEVMRDDFSVDSHVNHLSISTSEVLYRDMKDTIERLANEGNVQGFMRLVQSYEHWLGARDKAFQFFCEQYPEVVSQLDNHALQIRQPKNKCTFLVQWAWNVSDWYKVTPDIQLTVQVPRTVSPPNNIVKTAPATFQVMLKQLGLEKSIHSLVQLHVG